MDANTAYNEYMNEVHSYVHRIKHTDRRVFKQLDVYHPKFSQAHDEGRFRNPSPTHRLEHECGTPSFLSLFRKWLRA